jgi:hypothetical protein
VEPILEEAVLELERVPEVRDDLLVEVVGAQGLEVVDLVAVLGQIVRQFTRNQRSGVARMALRATRVSP